MADHPIPSLPISPHQLAREAVLLDALADVPLSDAERRSVRWLATWPEETVGRIASVIRKARAVGGVR